ncbi:MAG TPA: hypothetical protein VIT24_00860, partial [Acidimicrobiales bacterium]
DRSPDVAVAIRVGQGVVVESPDLREVRDELIVADSYLVDDVVPPLGIATPPASVRQCRREALVRRHRRTPWC